MNSTFVTSKVTLHLKLVKNIESLNKIKKKEAFVVRTAMLFDKL